jgi:hypothetical protein
MAYQKKWLLAKHQRNTGINVKKKQYGAGAGEKRFSA